MLDKITDGLVLNDKKYFLPKEPRSSWRLTADLAADGSALAEVAALMIADALQKASEGNKLVWDDQ